MQFSAATLTRMGEILGRVEDAEGLKARFAEMYALQQELREVLDTEVHAWLDTIPSDAKTAADTLYAAGGKRLRPILALLCGAAVGGDKHAAAKVAGAVELLHTGTLLHDDVVDEGEIRRGEPTARRVFGNALAVLSGDFCYFAALDALIELEDLVILQRAMRVARQLSEGELIQLQRRGTAHIDGEKEYFEIIECKTASLFAFSTWGGARCGGGSDEICAAADQFGTDLGLAFQIVDDILDFTGDPEVFGKALGHDVAEGTVTLPLAIAMAEDDALAADVQALVSDFAAGKASAIDPADIVLRVRASSGIEAARAKATALTQSALSSLEAFPESRYRRTLSLLTAALIERMV